MELQTVDYYFDQVYELLHKFPWVLHSIRHHDIKSYCVEKIMWLNEDVSDRLKFDKKYYGFDLNKIKQKIKAIDSLIDSLKIEALESIEEVYEGIKPDSLKIEEDVFEAIILTYAQLCESVTGSITEQHIAILLTATYGNEKVNQTTKAKELLMYYNLSGESKAVNRVVATWNRRIFNKSLKRQEFDLISRFWKDGKELKINVLD
ncbi:hypothetical protein N9R35_00205 [bacterium]|nr:hypothetical protein [bacterium]